MDYEQKYKSFVGNIMRAYMNALTDSTKAVLEEIYPELRESEDERIKKEIVRFIRMEVEDEIVGNKWIAWLEKQKPVKCNEEDNKIRKRLLTNFSALGKEEWGRLKVRDICAWLEKQGKIDNCPLECSTNTVMTDSKKNQVEPKFHEGEWVVLTAGELSATLQITKVDMNKKLYWFNDNSYLPVVDEECLHLWTIQDAKDGDVLVDEDIDVIGIFEGIEGMCWHSKFYYSNTTKEFYGIDCGGSHQKEFAKPATKEQRDTLMKAITDAGYKWDDEKKELNLLITNGGDFESENCEQKPVIDIDIPFGAKDSELIEASYYIPEGFHAEIEGNNVVIKKGEQKPATIDIDKMVDDYANNEEFGKPLNSMIRAYRQGLKDAIGKVVLKPTWSEEDDKMLYDAIGAVGAADYYTYDDKVEIERWLKSLKQRIGG